MSTTAPEKNTPSAAHGASWDSGWLGVGEGHRIYFEQSGNPMGIPVVVLHGGPGSGCSPRQRQLLDPDHYRVVMFDQRGCGRSTPRGECIGNHTAALVSDIERLREHLGIARWLVFGGSWGSSLGVVYCAQHRASCLGAILRGIFLTGRADIDWFFNGAATLRPAAWQRLAALAPKPQRFELAPWYFDAVAGADRTLALEAVSRWMQWEEALTHSGTGSREARMRSRTVDPETPPSPPSPPSGESEPEAGLDKYRVQAHYLRHECFIGEATLLGLAATLSDFPVAVLHGRDDRVCRPTNAERLRRVLPDARLQLVDGAGHSPFDPPMTAALQNAGRHFLVHGSFDAWHEAGD